MEVRTYYSTTVEAAMDLARRELGAEALLIQSRQAPAELSHLGRYEVVFAGDPGQAPVRALPKTPATPKISTEQSLLPRAAQKVFSQIPPVPELGPVDLVGNPEENAAAPRNSSSAGNRKRESKTEPEQFDIQRSRKLGELAGAISCRPGLGHSSSKSGTVALVGPAGAGKTTTLMKLAVLEGLMASRPVRIFACDPHRVGAAKQLRHFTELLGIAFTELASPKELALAVRESVPGLTLIDTAGFGRADTANLAEMARSFSLTPNVETQLVLRADRTSASNEASLARYAAMRPKRLILTALDETSDFQDLRIFLATARLPVSYLGTGQMVPEDLEAARSARLAKLIVGGWPEAARAA